MEAMASDLELWDLWLKSGVLKNGESESLRELRDEMMERLEKIKRKHGKGGGKRW